MDAMKLYREWLKTRTVDELDRLLEQTTHLSSANSQAIGEELDRRRVCVS